MSFGHIAASTILLPLGTAAFTWNKLDKTLKKLSVFILLSACAEAISIVLGSFGIYNMSISHIFTLLQVIIFAWIFIGVFKGWGKKVVVALLMLFVAFSILNWILWESFNEFNSNQRYIAGIVLMIYCAGYFMRIFVMTNIKRIELDPLFWMCASVLLYTTGTLFLFIFGQEILNGENHNTFWNLNRVLIIILNIGLTITLWLGTRKSQ